MNNGVLSLVVAVSGEAVFCFSFLCLCRLCFLLRFQVLQWDKGDTKHRLTVHTFSWRFIVWGEPLLKLMLVFLKFRTRVPPSHHVTRYVNSLPQTAGFLVVGDQPSESSVVRRTVIVLRVAGGAVTVEEREQVYVQNAHTTRMHTRTSKKITLNPDSFSLFIYRRVVSTDTLSVAASVDTR